MGRAVGTTIRTGVDSKKMWNPNEHSDDLNLRWCWLRATEWIRWPYFISQPVVPVMLVFWPWQAVIAIVLICNLIWYFLIRPNFISLPVRAKRVRPRPLRHRGKAGVGSDGGPAYRLAAVKSLPKYSDDWSEIRFR